MQPDDGEKNLYEASSSRSNASMEEIINDDEEDDGDQSQQDVKIFNEEPDAVKDEVKDEALQRIQKVDQDNRCY